MKAMILAAGRGERMMPLTENTPKPMLLIDDKPLIQYTVEALVKAGITELVINLAYLGEQIETYIGNGDWLGASVRYSYETNALETGGGIMNALPLLGEQPFIIVNSDVWTDYPFQRLTALTNYGLAHLVMVDNPKQNTHGDFLLTTNKTETLSFVLQQPHDPHKNQQDESLMPLTYSGIAIIDPKLFSDCKSTDFRLREPLIQHMKFLQITGEYYSGDWLDIGTPERLSDLRKSI